MASAIRERELINTPTSEPSNPSEETERLFEPKVIFRFPNGKGGYQEEEVSLSTIEDKILMSYEKEGRLKKKLNGTRKSLKSLKERKHGSGRLRSRGEMTQIRNETKRAQRNLKGRMATLQAEIEFLERSLNISRTSDLETPLTIKPAEGKKIELFINGRQLSEEEAEWRELVGEYTPALWHHPKIEFLKKAYSLQRAAYEEWVKQGLDGPKQRRWEKFKSDREHEFPEKGEIKELMIIMSARFSRYEDPFDRAERHRRERYKRRHGRYK